MKWHGLYAALGAGLLMLSSVSLVFARPVLRGNPLWEVPVKSLTATRERPIFSPSRRPPPPVTVAAPYVTPRAPVRPPSPQLTLLGTVFGVTDGGSANTTDGIGIFLDQTNNAVVRLKTGDYHNGWLLRSVQSRETTLHNERDTVVLALPARGSERGGASHANTNASLSEAQPAGKPVQNFQLEKYD